MSNVHPFSFAEEADTFDEHIETSIPGYNLLSQECVKLSQRFIQNETSVIDIGCTTGRLLKSVTDHNECFHNDVIYTGLDVEPAYSRQWVRLETSNLRFQVADARRFEGYVNLSLAMSIFTIQFMPEKDKLKLLQRVYDGLVPGGAVVIAEKVYADDGRMQDALATNYHERKLGSFTPEAVFEKQRKLFGYMTLWTETEFDQNLRAVGFRTVQRVWMNFPFVAVVAVK